MGCQEGLKQLEPESINCCISSPPYYGLRDYKIEPSIWDGDPDCEHDFELEEKKCGGGHSGGIETSGLFTKEQAIKRKEGTGSGNIIKEGFCSKCGAWKGTLGLEPNFELYIKHLCDIYDQVKRVLKKTGTNWVNMGDTYGGHKGEMRNPGYKDKEKGIQYRKDAMGSKENFYLTPKKYKKCLLMIPQRFAMEMVNRGWILRNVIIWHKPNCMPSSAKDRFTVDFEYVYFFVKSNNNQYWINEKTTRLVSKRPLGSKGTENVDWEWRECDKCLGTGIKHKKCKFCVETGWYYDEFLRPRKCPKCRGLGRIKMDSECKSCKGKGIKKHNFWRGKQYFFEQQRDLYTEPLNRWGGNKHSDKYIADNKYKNQDKVGCATILREGYKIRPNPTGKNKRTVWTIPTKANPETHFATFPPKLVEPMILSGCPEFICKECGNPREKIFDVERIPTRPGLTTKYEDIDIKWSPGRNESMRKRIIVKKTPIGYSNCGCFDNIKYSKSGLNLSPTSTILTKKVQEKRIIGLTDCNHGSQWKPGIVLDPFAGIGTTLLTAWKLGRNYIGFEISKEYCKIANKKLSSTNYVRLDNFIEEKIEGNV